MNRVVNTTRVSRTPGREEARTSSRRCSEPRGSGRVREGTRWLLGVGYALWGERDCANESSSSSRLDLRRILATLPFSTASLVTTTRPWTGSKKDTSCDRHRFPASRRIMVRRPARPSALQSAARQDGASAVGAGAPICVDASSCVDVIGRVRQRPDWQRARPLTPCVVRRNSRVNWRRAKPVILFSVPFVQSAVTLTAGVGLATGISLGSRRLRSCRERETGMQ